MTDRISCCVPFCRRTKLAVPGLYEFICSDHTKLVNRPTRRKYKRFLRRYQQVSAPTEHVDIELYKEARRLVDILNWMFERMKKQAIERSAGL